MLPIESHILISGLIVVDITIVVIFIYLLKRLNYFRKSVSLEKEIGLFESLIADSEKAAGQFKSQLEEKHLLIKGLEEKLNEKISGITLLLNRAEALLSTYGKEDYGPAPPHMVADAHRERVISLAREGCRSEEIAQKLSLPMGEVKLTLDLNEKFLKLKNEGDAT